MMLSGPFKSSLKLRGMNGKIMQGDSTLEYYSRVYIEYIVEYLGGFSRETEPIGNSVRFIIMNWLTQLWRLESHRSPGLMS